MCESLSWWMSLDNYQAYASLWGFCDSVQIMCIVNFSSLKKLAPKLHQLLQLMMQAKWKTKNQEKGSEPEH